MNSLDRRQLAAMVLAAGCGLALGEDPLPGKGKGGVQGLRFRAEQEFPAVEARFWEKLPEKKVKCRLCPHECQVADRERGTCGVRENRGGKYYTLVHSRICSMGMDPVEKKPFFHFRPGTQAFSIATPGCNLECQYCQNWQISQFRPEQVKCSRATPGELAAAARSAGAVSMAYTYSEPVVFYEFMTDVAEACRSLGLNNLLISNGFIQADPMKRLLPLLSAVKIDFKGFSEDFYSRICSGRLRPVLDTLSLVAGSGKLLEIVMLVVPTLNDDRAESDRMFRWIRNSLGDSVPLHLTRFHPTYKLGNLPPTPVATLERMRNQALSVGLRFVYLGNVPGHPAEHTNCPSCGKLLIQRVGFEILQNLIRKGKCPGCGAVIPGVF